MYRVETHCGYCPMCKDEHCIDITYSEIRSIGMTASQYRKGSFSCDYEECPLDADCPIYQAAPLVEG